MNPPRIPSGSTLTQSTATANPTTAVNLPPVPQYNLVQGRLGAQIIPGQAVQGQLGLVIQPLSALRVGAQFSTNFGSRHEVMFNAGTSLRLNDFMRLNLLGLGGFAILDNDASQQGRLQQAVMSSGAQGFVGLGVELETQLTRNIGLYAQASAQRVFNGSLEATPAQLRPGEEVNPDAWRFTINLGASFGGVARPRVGTPEETPPPVVTPPQGTLRDRTQERIEHMERDLDQRIEQLQTSLTAEMEASRRAQIDTAINGIQSSINDLNGKIQRLSSGINDVNFLLTAINRVSSSLPQANSTLGLEQRRDLTQALDIIEAALRNSGPNAALNARLRTAFLYIPNADRNHPRLINSFVNRLGENELEALLRSHNEGALADRVRDIRTQCSAFARENPQVISVTDLLADVQRLEGSLTTLSALVGPTLQQDARWTSLRDALNQARDQVNLNYRTTLVYNRLHALLSDHGTFFIPLVMNPALARTRFEQTAAYLRNFTNEDATRGVTMANLQDQFGQFPEALVHNLEVFIRSHTRPEMTSGTELRRWLPSVQAAHDLACIVNATSAACQAPVNGSSGAQPAPAPARPARPTAPGVVVNPDAAAIRTAQRTATAQARAARADATAARSALNAVAAASRGNIEAIVREVEGAATAAEAAATAANANGVNLETANEQAGIARTQAGIARTKMNEVERAIRAIPRPQVQNPPPPPPPAPEVPVVPAPAPQPAPTPTPDVPPAPPAAPVGDAGSGGATDEQGRPIRLRRRQRPQQP